MGGGPAGLSAAIAFAQSGAAVQVVEAQRPPIDKACGEGLMPDSRVELAKLGITLDRPEGGEFRGIHFANRNSGREDCVTAQFANGIGLGVRRVHLHERMVERAMKLGVRIAWGVHVGLGKQGEVLVEAQPVKYGHLIGADGQGSAVRRWAGLETRLADEHPFWLSPPLQGEALERKRRGPLGRSRSGIRYSCGSGGDLYRHDIRRRANTHEPRCWSSIPFLRERLSGFATTTKQRGAVTTTRRLKIRCARKGRIDRRCLGICRCDYRGRTGYGLPPGVRCWRRRWSATIWRIMLRVIPEYCICP